MESKQLEIACPCCETRILVDLRTGQILRSRGKAEVDSDGKPRVGERDWDEALGRVEDRAATRESRLDAALDREKGKSDRLDELFRKASEKLDEEETD